MSRLSRTSRVSSVSTLLAPVSPPKASVSVRTRRSERTTCERLHLAIGINDAGLHDHLTVRQQVFHYLIQRQQFRFAEGIDSQRATGEAQPHRIADLHVVGRYLAQIIGREFPGAIDLAVGRGGLRIFRQALWTEMTEAAPQTPGTERRRPVLGHWRFQIDQRAVQHLPHCLDLHHLRRLLPGS